MKVDLKTLQNFLISKNYDAKIQQETNQIYVIVKVAEKEYPFFLRIFQPSELLQILAFMPCQIKHGVHGDLARLLHFINKELDIPGFGMDENTGVAFYRCMLPTPEYHIEESLFETFFRSIELICESIAPAVISTATGLTTFNEIMRKAQEIEQKSHITP